jgi:flagellar hook-length control protein FliK
MNVTPPTPQAPPAAGPAQANAAASAAVPAAEANSQDFAHALSDAAGKPARTINGRQLPPAGKRSPSLPLPPQGSLPLQPALVPTPASAAQPPLPPPALLLQPTPALQQAAMPQQAPPPTDSLPGTKAGPACQPGGAPAAAGTLPGATRDAAATQFASIAQTADDESTATAGSAVAQAAAAKEVAVPTSNSASRDFGRAAGTDQVEPVSTNSPSPTPVPLNTVSTAQTLMAAAVAQTSGALGDDSSSAVLPAVELPAAAPAATMNSDAAAAGAASAQDSSQAAASAAGVVAAQLIARPAAAAAAASAADIAAVAAAKSLSVHTHSTVDGAAGAAQFSSAAAGTSNASPMPTMKVAASVDSAEFGQGVAAQVSLMVDSNLTQAKLQVNPPALGPIEVRIALQDGHAQVWLTSHSALTRDALESSSPNLREMLSSQGFSQVSVDISHRSFQDRSPQSQSQTYDSRQVFERGEISGAVPSSGISPRAAIGIVDAYA